MQTYEMMMRRQYDNELCTQLFRELMKKPKDDKIISDIIEASLPVLSRVLQSNFRRIQLGTEEYDEVLSSVPVSFYMYLISDKFYEKYYSQSESHFSFLYGIFRYEILNVLKRVKRFQRSDMELPHSPVMAMNLSTAPVAIEYNTLLKELPQYIYDEICKRFRFTEEENLICETIAYCTILSPEFDGTSIVPRILIHQVYDIEEERMAFFEDYVRSNIYIMLFDYKNQIDIMPSVLEGVLNSSGFMIQEVFSEGMHSSKQHEFWMGVDGEGGRENTRRKEANLGYGGWYARP